MKPGEEAKKMLASCSRAGPASPVYVPVRNFSRRRIAYPFYPTKSRGRTEKKDHKTNLRFQMEQFLGKKNFKGEYASNKYFSAPKNHQPNYITPDLENGQALVDLQSGKPLDIKGNVLESTAFVRPERKLMPFPSNPFCQTNLALTNEDKEEIYTKVCVQKVPIQEVAVNFGIKIPRLEAVVRLKEIEKKWQKQNRITPEIKTMSSTMYKMFPLFERPRHSDNLSEIPVPVKTLQSRFLTIAESEPFGPIDAAKVFDLEPASETLQRLAETGHHATVSNKKDKQVFVAESAPKDRYVFKFHKAKVGQVGFRYGATLRDNKKDRKFSYDDSGKMVNALPTSG